MKKTNFKYGEIYINKISKRLEINCLKNVKGSKIIAINENDEIIYIITEDLQKKRKLLEITKEEEVRKNKEEEEFLENNLQDIIEIKQIKKRKIFLTKNNEVYVMGEGDCGSLGLGSINKENEPRNIFKKNMNGIMQMASGDNHSVLLMTNGDIKVWGAGFGGQLGLSFLKLSAVPVYLPFFENLKKNSLEVKPRIPKPFNSASYLDYLEKKEKKEKYEKVISVFAAGDHCFALTNKGDLYAWGDNIYGQLGLGKKKKYFLPQKVNLREKIKKVSSSKTHTLLLTKQGDIYVSGLNNYGQLGTEANNLSQFTKLIKDIDDNALPKFKEIKSNFKSSLALDEKNNIYYWGISLFENFKITAPKLFDYSLKGIPSITDIYLTNTHFLLFSPLLFKKITPSILPSIGGTNFQIKGYGLAQFSQNQLIRFSTKRINYKFDKGDKINESLKEIDNLSNRSEVDLNEYEDEKYSKNEEVKDLTIYQEFGIIFDESNESLNCLNPDYDIDFADIDSIEVIAEISLDGEIWEKTPLSLFVYNEKTFELGDFEPKIFSFKDNQKFKIQVRKLGGVALNFLEHSKLCFQDNLNNEEILQEVEIVDNYLECSIPKFEKNTSLNFKAEIIWFPNGQNFLEIPQKTFLTYYKVEVNSIKPFSRKEGEKITHYLEARGIFETKEKKIKLKGKEGEIELDLNYDEDKNQFYFQSQFCEDLFISQKQEKEENQEQINIAIGDEEEREDEKFINAAKVLLTLCGRDWYEIGELIFCKTNYKMMMVAPPRQKKENEEEYKNRLFVKEAFEFIDEENEKKKDKIKKEIIKNKLNLVNQLNTTLIRSGTIIWIEGNNFLKNEKIFIQLRLHKNNQIFQTLEIEGFVKNEKCFIFEVPFFTYDNFEVFDCYVAFSFNNLQFIQSTHFFKFLVIKKDIDEAVMAKEITQFIKNYGKVKINS